MINVCINTSSYIVSAGLHSVLKELNCNFNIKILTNFCNDEVVECDFLLADTASFNKINSNNLDIKVRVIIIDEVDNNFISEKSKKNILENFSVIFCNSNANDIIYDDVTDREREIIKLVASGFTNKQIADQLFLSIHTVITHRKNISAKLGIKSISGLTIYAVLNGIINLKN